MYPRDPAKAIAKAQYTGLTSLRNILRERVNKDTKEIYERVSERLSNAIEAWRESKRQKSPNFSLITREENHLRKAELKNIWETTATYGNKANKRVKSEREGKVDPLNLLLNIAGAQLREHLMTLFPFPKPMNLGWSGRRQIWGYIGRSNLGEVQVSHGGNLPELDFGDMIRSHLRELARKAFIAKVPPKDFRYYTNLLLTRLTPFLEHVYTDGREGRWGFNRPRNQAARERQSGPDANYLLREIVQEIEALYGRYSAKPITPTREIAETYESIDSRFFKRQIDRLLQEGQAAEGDDRVRKITSADFIASLLDRERPCLRDQDAHFLQNKVVTDARWYGIQIHRRIQNLFPRPYSLRSIVLDGEKFVEKDQVALIAAEVPIQTSLGRGRADLVVFKRHTIIDDQMGTTREVFAPVAVFDIKTRSAFRWEIKAKNTQHQRRKRKRNKTYPVIETSKRVLTDREWRAALAHTPTQSERTQIRTYGEGLVKEYQRMTRDDSIHDILRGIILIDASIDRTTLQKTIRQFVLQMTKDEIPSECDHVQIETVMRDAQRMAVILDNPDQRTIAQFQKEQVASQEANQYNPFSEVEKGHGEHMLYLGVQSLSKAGPIIEWVARYKHGLKFIQRIHKKRKTDIVWLDLSGSLSKQRLAETRLRFGPKELDLRGFFRSIKITSLQKPIEWYLYHGMDAPNLSEDLKGCTRNTIIVVSGWDEIQKSTPTRLRHQLAELERTLVVQIRETKATTVWFDRAKPAEWTSQPYQQRGALPFWGTSIHRRYVTRIIWNLPVRPYATSHSASMYEELRIVIHEKREQVREGIVLLDSLRDISEKFLRGTIGGKRIDPYGRGRPFISPEEVLNGSAITVRENLLEDAFTLIPWVNRLIEKCTVDEDLIELELTYSRRFVQPVSDRGLFSRLVYEPSRGGTGLGYIPVSSLATASRITHPRHYRRDYIKGKPVKSIHLPPNPNQFTMIDIDWKRVLEREIGYVKRAIRLILNTCKNEDILKFVVSLSVLLEENQSPKDLIKRIVRRLEQDPVSVELWNQLKWVRRRLLSRNLREDCETQIQKLINTETGSVYRIGNHFFLLILALYKEFNNLKKGTEVILWSFVRSWILWQLGLHVPQSTDKNATIHKLDLRAIWHNMTKRIEYISSQPVSKQTGVRHGKLIEITGIGDYYNYWFFIQDEYDSSNLLYGLWTKYNPLMVRPTVNWSESVATEVVNAAEDALDPVMEWDVVLVKEDGEEFLWLHQDDEWEPIGSIEIIKQPKEAISSIRGILMKHVSEDWISLIQNVGSISNSIDDSIMNILEKLNKHKTALERVSVTVSIENESYVVEYSSSEIQETRHLSDTYDLVRLLRNPIASSMLESKDKPGIMMTWDVYHDIEFENLDVIRPFVFWRSPFTRIDAQLPPLCRDLLEAKEIDLEISIGHERERCPLARREGWDHQSCWTVSVDGKYSKNTGLQGCWTDGELAEIFQTEQIYIDGHLYNIEVCFESDPKSKEGMIYNESETISRHLQIECVYPGQYLTANFEKLFIRLKLTRNMLVTSLYSSITQREVHNGIIYDFEKIQHQEMEQIFEEVIQRLENIVSHHFNEDIDLEEKIDNIQEVIAKIKHMIRRKIFSKIGCETKKGYHREKCKLEYLSEYCSGQGFYEEELAYILYETAWNHYNNERYDLALDFIQRAVFVIKSIPTEYDSVTVDHLSNQIEEIVQMIDIAL
ncbi:MAG: hypothetical protein BAJATHORv1_20539 [Candidatus Thorarchaeota archaeon]|nr:MAG: hypothetical protein BAJATHORv1_20539 [Candidatus Thorarchaeota archaeon]